MMQSNQMQPGVDGRTSGETTMLYGHCIIYIYILCVRVPVASGIHVLRCTSS